ncbi:hypothetical protein LCGC14_1549430 [marine sediment metagenome]|uniref:Radical SAM core domain-containing protein n=1 Tax=marine sediment metagenome TaxID=412755 RepID=A0A0F9LRL1_9ZZZZ
MNNVVDKVYSDKRLSFEEGVNLIKSFDLIGLGTAADRLCQKLHPEQYRTYIIDRNINYTNVCISGCKFCAFYREKDNKESYVLSKDELRQMIKDDNLPPALQKTFDEAKEAVNWNIDILKAKYRLRKVT